MSERIGEVLNWLEDNAGKIITVTAVVLVLLLVGYLLLGIAGERSGPGTPLDELADVEPTLEEGIKATYDPNPDNDMACIEGMARSEADDRWVYFQNCTSFEIEVKPPGCPIDDNGVPAEQCRVRVLDATAQH